MFPVAVAFRIVIIPLQVYTMRASIHYQNHMPTVSKYQEKIARATELKDVQTGYYIYYYIIQCHSILYTV